MDSILREQYRKHQDAFNVMIEDEFVRVVGQAIKCGDIQAVVRQDYCAVGVVYIPYHDKMKLEAKIKALESENASLREQLIDKR